MDRCILLNGDYTFLNTVNWKKAVRLLMTGKAEAIKYSNKCLHSSEGLVLKIPSVMKLIRVIRMIYKNKVPYTKKNIMIRDGQKCVYCGSNDSLTIDHVIPLSQGGKSSFENCVTSCFKCNNLKGSRTPSQAKMYMKRQPYQPTISEFFIYKMKQLGFENIIKDLGGF